MILNITHNLNRADKTANCRHRNPNINITTNIIWLHNLHSECIIVIPTTNSSTLTISNTTAMPITQHNHFIMNMTHTITR